MPLGDDCEAVSAWDYIANQVDTIDLIDVGQAEKKEDEEEETPVPDFEIYLYIL